MSLAGDGKGTIYAGTNDSALVMKVASDGKVTVVHDFPGNEVTAIDYYDGQLAVAANEFKIKPGTRFKTPAPVAPVPASPAARRKGGRLPLGSRNRFLSPSLRGCKQDFRTHR